MSWIFLKCISCKVEYSDFDLEIDEITDDIKTDEHGQILVVCDDCQE